MCTITTLDSIPQNRQVVCTCITGYNTYLVVYLDIIIIELVAVYVLLHQHWEAVVMATCVGLK